jgi:hypothetical protein
MSGLPPGGADGPSNPVLQALWRGVFWTYDRATWQYDLMVIAILAFVWLTPPDWLADPHAQGMGLIGWMAEQLQ